MLCCLVRRSQPRTDLTQGTIFVFDQCRHSFHYSLGSNTNSSALYVTILGISGWSWGLRFVCFLPLSLTWFLLNEQLLVWKVARSEILLWFCFYKGRDAKRWGEGLRQVTVNANMLQNHYQALDFQAQYFYSLFNEHFWVIPTTASTQNTRAFQPVSGNGLKSAESERSWCLCGNPK